MAIELPPETTSQTAGPYVHIGLALEAAGLPPRDQEIWNQLARPEAPGEHIAVVGRVFDGNGHLVRDAFLEFWQADAEGNYQPAYDLSKPFVSFGRAATTFDAGEWRIDTIKPGRVQNGSGKTMAPHICVALFARGINVHLQTRIYFEDEDAANQQDPIFNAIETPERRQTLIAQRSDDSEGVIYRFDMHLQGPLETVFFDV
ncbi:MAG: protocatechuate 3,4-dioxygenase subunit alpha [Aquisalimonadaceae bacterium]